MINPSNLNRKIKIQRKLNVINELNESVPTWITINSVYAQVTPINAKEVFRSNKLNSDKLCKFVIHYVKDIRYEDRLEFEGKPFDIRNIAEIGLRGGIEILAEGFNAKT